MNCWRILFLGAVFAMVWVSAAPADDQPDPARIVKTAVDYYRGDASESLVVMTVHRPDWERSMTIRAWTKGQKDSAFIIVDPARDKGNGTLKRGREMWTYNPKVNRVIKLPPSMMSQAWMGSDFSNNDIAKSDTLIEDYIHRLVGTESDGEMPVYVIESLPKPGAPVVWGMQRLKIRKDGILIVQEFFDEDKVLVKSMTAYQIDILGGKKFPKFWKMQKSEAQDEYTVLEYQELAFKSDIPDRYFSIAALKNPRR
jgi:outer membrane lipoprotein-sorting protein